MRRISVGQVWDYPQQPRSRVEGIGVTHGGRREAYMVPIGGSSRGWYVNPAKLRADGKQVDYASRDTHAEVGQTWDYPGKPRSRIREIRSTPELLAEVFMTPVDGESAHWETSLVDLELKGRRAHADMPVQFADAEPRKHSHYFRSVEHLSEIDIYRFLDLFNVTDQALGHAIKKLVVPGMRGGGKTGRKDIEEAVDTLQRKLEMLDEDAAIEKADDGLTEGWTAWDGRNAAGPLLPLGCVISISLREDVMVLNVSPDTCEWKHTGGPRDILAYRIAESAPMASTAFPVIDADAPVPAEPHAELRKTWNPGQRWQCRSKQTGEWIDIERDQPLWESDYEYRRYPDFGPGWQDWDGKHAFGPNRATGLVGETRTRGGGYSRGAELDGLTWNHTGSPDDIVAYRLPGWKPSLTGDPHAELRKTWKPGQRWQWRSSVADVWLDCSGEPMWEHGLSYRRHPDDAAVEWIDWDGRNADGPVRPADAVLAARLRADAEITILPGNQTISWTHEGNGGDIVAYRLLS